MSEKYIIKRSSLENFFKGIKSANREVYAPANAIDQPDKAEFRTIENFAEFREDYIQTVSSVKSVVFPRFEKILKYYRDQEGMKVEDIDLSKVPEMVLFGVHPCDAASFSVLNKVFTWDIKDKFIVEKLNKVTIVGLSCDKSDDFCFCTSVGLQPNNPKGSDILLSKSKSGDYIAEVLTEKGKALFESSKDVFEAYNNEESVVADVPVKFDHKKVTEKLETTFESPIWYEQALRCLGCGACAYVCPTCSCFDIQDLGGRNKGFRVKCWDSCGFSLFTHHTSGHNPRETQPDRWRQRIMHKFSYQPDRLEILGCVGCGRCSRACPVDMNIQEHVTSILN